MEENKMPEKLESFTVPAEDGTELTLYIVDQTRINGKDYLLATDTEEDGGNAYIFLMTPDEEDPGEMILNLVEDDDYDYIAGVFAEPDDIGFE